MQYRRLSQVLSRYLRLEDACHSWHSRQNRDWLHHIRSGPENHSQFPMRLHATHFELKERLNPSAEVSIVWRTNMETKTAWDSEAQKIRPMTNLYERLLVNDDWTFHSRTSELIHNCYSPRALNPYKRRKHLASYPCVIHDQQQNRSCGATLQTIFFCDVNVELKRIVPESETIGHSTKQYETVWFSKGMRRK